MKSELHGIISAYRTSPDLGTLVHGRTASALTFAGRYRLVDFALSSMRLAGVRNVGVLMQKEYQSLLDHIGSGKVWDFSRKEGGMTLLPPFSLDAARSGVYTGLLEALLATESYIQRIQEQYIAIMPGNLAANIDLRQALKEHIDSGAGITAVCARGTPNGEHHRYLIDENGDVLEMHYRRITESAGVADLETYIVNKNVLLEMVDVAASHMRYRLHADGIAGYLERGGKMHTYIHEGYAVQINTVQNYMQANMEMLSRDARRSLFPLDRPILTKDRADVSTYYAETSKVTNSLISDGCYIEGIVENCIIMRDTHIGENVRLKNVISDKYAQIKDGQVLVGSENVPLVIPRGYTA